MDLVFVLDASTSVTEPNFLVMKDFVKDVLENANIDDGHVRVGAIIYSNEDYLQFNLNEHQDKLSLFRAIDNIPYRYGGAYTASALYTMRTKMFRPNRGDRRDVQNVAILITDGASTIRPRRTMAEARRIKGAGIHIYAIGVGLTDTTELDAIASRPLDENRFVVDNFADLRNFRSDVFAVLCESMSFGSSFIQNEEFIRSISLLLLIFAIGFLAIQEGEIKMNCCMQNISLGEV